MSKETQTLKERYLARAEFAGRMIGHVANNRAFALLDGLMEAVEHDMLSEWMAVMEPLLEYALPQQPATGEEQPA